MAKPSKEIIKKRGENVRKLLKWWNDTHPGEKKIQADIASYLNIDPTALSGKIKGEDRYLNEEDARMIAAFFPGSRVEFALGYDDYITESEKFGAAISDMQDEDHLLLLGLNAFAKLCDYQIDAPVFKDHCSVEEALKPIREGYTIRKDDRTVRLSLKEMNDFENEVCDFVDLKLKHLFKQKGERDDGKHSGAPGQKRQADFLFDPGTSWARR